MTGQPCGYSNGTGQQYVYGFCVPLMVGGAYAKPGYVSGAHVNSPIDCQHNTYCHDFGSILNFIEYAFGTGGNQSVCLRNISCYPASQLAIS